MNTRARLVAALGLTWLAAQPLPADAADVGTKKATTAETRQAAKVERVAAGLSPSLDPQTKCLALSVYWEGRSESEMGRAAIAHTVLNRSRSSQFPKGICSVVTEGDNDGKKGCQFAWWCDGKSDEPKNHSQWTAAVQTARQAMDGKIADPTGGALYFHGDRDNPKWAKQRQRLTRIGNHVFYR